MRKTLALLTLAVAPVLAGDTPFEAGLLIDKVKFKDISSGSSSTQPKDQTGFALRFGRDVAKFGTTALQVNGSYRFQSSGDYDGVYGPAGVKYKNSYWALGGMFHWQVPMDLGLGLEYRSEKLEVDATSAGAGTYSDTWGRGWVRANAGWTFQTSAAAKPFVGLDIAFPLSSKSFDPATATPSDLPRLGAPTSQIGLYGGVRF
ncbi:MAG TPA: hypothetical protein VJ570_04130 [Holophagaceae bacterium]|nr:hypothetical protein [Holophagaceae bacterium]